MFPLRGILLTILIVFNFSGALKQEQEWRPERLGNVLESTLVRYYIFSLNNPEEVRNGSDPEMVELGPFTYREKRLKKNMLRLDDTTLQYDIDWSMHYLPELTKPGLNEDTEFTSLNAPFITMSEGLAAAGLPKAFNAILVDEILEAGETLIRPEIKFGESLFYGYNVSVYTAILDDITQGQTEERYPELAGGKFAFYKNKNGTITATYKVHSTKETPFGNILTYQGYPTLGFWPKSSHCDDLSDSLDFFTFPKRITKDTVFNIFLPENCRSLQLRYVQEDIFRGIPVYVFKFPLDQFSNNLYNDGTSCYCFNFHNASDPQCLDSGFMDYSGCSKGAPLVGSFPHFLHANPRHFQNIQGLSPNKSLHESEIMIEPITGTPLYAVRRFQLNLHTRPIPAVTYFENMTERIVPLAWFEHILEVPSTTFTTVKQKLEELRLQESSAKDIYEHDENPIEEMDDNTLFASRSGFPSSASSSGVVLDDEEPTRPEESNEIGNATASAASKAAKSNLHSSCYSYFAVVTTALILLFSSESSLNQERIV
ncbi:unnamed protein product [Orchesella dallaii]|uniref:Lysosome membrane protein 2 n=1 Tax=Orchesella dallaii TaxID=48710 RepID=A0ABP1S2G7_9HEXA